MFFSALRSATTTVDRGQALDVELRVLGALAGPARRHRVRPHAAPDPADVESVRGPKIRSLVRRSGDRGKRGDVFVDLNIFFFASLDLQEGVSWLEVLIFSRGETSQVTPN